MDAAGLEILSAEECLRLLDEVAVGRIVYTDRALPAIQPVNFIVDGPSVVIRTASRSRLAIAATGAVVAFEVDEFSDEWVRCGWSVVAVGMAAQVTDERELAAVRRRGLEPWAPGAREYYLRVDIAIISGRRLKARQRVCGR
ncbi:pyridoxamine 5'-phosphate oxidase family protein [Actinocrispum wychmicini]|uniref:Nitroimidazol reductase NimA-like FMN-containing flavoprotein (Pyridoxamine 5'-phosphate oxidase superfamily) n=1 Tax=Actinocrispum wychmicini TaxID=1213861 RepID=A0A4R2JXU7_9PSEU|nr:pyridoxamine 5'-phosphate oxidase family protein [Actinocrispum wychmicini]TCO62248.1 nitroimidazol reductase NimA-like FMN-containing flavoprotein (pyridoxamine 5'-phosphate oxidase superfamily) [Actinocrispum wychmicini]